MAGDNCHACLHVSGIALTLTLDLTARYWSRESTALTLCSPPLQGIMLISMTRASLPLSQPSRALGVSARVPRRRAADQAVEGRDGRAVHVADVDRLEAGLRRDVAGDRLGVACAEGAEGG